MTNFLRKPLVLKIISILIAVIIWVYVINKNNPEIDEEVRSVIVTINTADSTPYRNGLAITEGLSQTIDVKIRGRHNAIAAYDKSQISATVDINSITEEGTYSLPVTVYVPGDNVWLVNHTPTRLTYTFSKITTQTIPVEVNVTGTKDPSYDISMSDVSPQTVTVKGPSNEINYISHALLTIDLTGVRSDCSLTDSIILVDRDGKSVSSKNVSCDKNQASVEISAKRIKEVELVFTSEGEDESLLYEVRPKSVKVTGDESTLKALTKINLGTIDLSQLRSGESMEVTIPVPEGTTLLSGQKAVITAMKDTEETSYIKNVSIDTSQMPSFENENLSIELSEDKITVELEGDSDVLKAITAENITVTPDFSHINDKIGTYYVPLTVTINRDDVRIIGSYTITAEVK